LRLGARKLIYVRRNRINKKKVSVFLVVVLFIMLVLYSALFFLKTVRPILAAVSEAQANYMATKVINDSVNGIFTDSGITYQDLVAFERDTAGNIKAVQSNMASVNELKATVSIAALEKIANLSEAGIEIPMGSLLGSDLLAGMGPRINVKLMPVGNIYVNFLSGFQEAGINQTKLEINLEVEANVMLLMPTIRKNSKVVTKLPVIQTVIVGDVPDSYTNVEREGGTFENDILDVIPSE
jgi:sporulation protein YunB